MRERLVAALAWAFTRTALIVAPKPATPPESRWSVTLDETKNTVCFYIMFLHGHLRRGEWHVATVCDFPEAPPVMVDAGIGRCWITPLKPQHVDTVISRLRPEFLVTLRVTPEGFGYHSSIGPITCVTLAKRLLGVHNPGIVTSRQLLDLLWRYRDGRS